MHGVFVLMALACSASHGVRPLGEGRSAIEASLGGPIARVYGKPIPIPLSTVGYRYGLSDRSDLRLRAHLTPLVMFGAPAFDVGASRLLLEPDGARPALVVEGAAIGVLGGTGAGPAARFYGELEGWASWAWGKRANLVYTGADLFFQPYDLLTEDTAQGADTRHLLAGVEVGNRFALGERVGFSTELTWWNPWSDTERLLAYYYAPSFQGAFSVQLGLSVAFGGER